MTQEFFRELKHYSIHEIAENLNTNDLKAKNIASVLKRYGVIKVVNRNTPDLAELSDDDLVLTDGVVDSNDVRYVFNYVGVIVLKNHVIKCYPKYISSSDEPMQEFKQVLKVIKLYSARYALLNVFNGEDDNRSFNKLAVELYLLEDYYANGIYSNDHRIIEDNGIGEILWDRTINTTFALMQDEQPYYLNMLTSRNTIDDDNFFKQLHECILTLCSKSLCDLGLLNIFEIEPVEISLDELDSFGDKDYILYRLDKEIRSQYVTRKQTLLKVLYTYISESDSISSGDGVSLYGTNSFNVLWEKVCASVFDNKLNVTLNKLDLKEPLSEVYSSKSKKTLLELVEKPAWYSESEAVPVYPNKTLIPDLVAIENINGEDHFAILDAKYYNLVLEKDKLMDNPGVGDVAKQYLYQLAYSDFLKCQKINHVYNVFLMPTEGDIVIHKGRVSFSMLRNLNLKDIEISMLPARYIFECYLHNKKEKLSYLKL